MPIEREVKQKIYLKVRIPDKKSLEAMKADAQRIIAGNSEGKPLFADETIKLFKQVLKDLETLKID